MTSDSLGPPYGPPANISTILHAWRERGLPAVVDRAWFERIGLSGNLATRNLHALRFLRLVDAAQRPTDLAERLRIAASDAFPTTLAAIVRTSYAKAWSIADPATSSRAKIDDAFRHEAPAAQRSRMVACFIGLCRLAEIIAADHRLVASERPATRQPPPIRPERRDATEPPSAPAGSRELLHLLLGKFPDFDPAWPDGVKEKWFDAFSRLRDEVVR